MAIPGTQPPSLGRYRRVIDLARWDERTVVGWLEDDFHHFGMTIEHDNGIVTDVRVAAVRLPWTTCPGAAVQLRDLIGKRLIARASDVGRFIEMRKQCTHMFDLGGLLLAQAIRGSDHRRYEATVTDSDLIESGASDKKGAGPRMATLFKDGVQVMEWRMEKQSIVWPPPYAGHHVSSGFREWTETLPVEEAEFATVLRRAIFVSGGRLVDHSTFERASDHSQMTGSCYTNQSERSFQARHVHTSVRRFDDSGADMLPHVGTKP